VKLAHAVGAKILLDGCQAVARLAVDVKALGCDFYVCSAHKLYGPTGIGALWARADILDAMPLAGRRLDDRPGDLRENDLCPRAATLRGGHARDRRGDRLRRGGRFVRGIGLDAIHAHEAALVARARGELSRLNSVRLFGPEDSAGIVSFALEGVHPHDLGTILDEEGVAIRAGHHCAQPLMDHLGVPATARASFGIYSDDSDIAALVRGIERTMRIFG
jgi:cysteine desulfurase/selenocysteine lyase